MQGDFKVKKPARKPAQKLDLNPPKPDEPETIFIDGGEKVATKRTVTGKNPWLHVKAWWNARDRNTRFGIIAAVCVIFVAVVLGIYFLVSPTSNPDIQIKHNPKKVAAPITIPSPLTGVQVSPAQAARPITGIMIENSLDARPQSGLQDAGVVYEAIAEAGITRFLALFQENTPQYIGPVRSLRPYFIDYAAPFQASIVHVGGSPDALREVQNGQFRNLDQFFNGPYFWRTSRPAPHNVYTSFARLDVLEKSKGYTKSSFTSWPRKTDSKLSAPTASSIDFAISSGDYHVHYSYKIATNNYYRSEGGRPHIDLVSSSDKTGVRLRPRVVIALVVPLSNGQLDSSGAYYSDYTTSGSGVAYIFQDGGVTKGTWTKEGTFGQLQLTDASGHAMKLNAGQTWITLVDNQNEVTYK